MPPAARLGDLHVCPAFTGIVPHVGGPIMPPCTPTVITLGMPQAKVGDLCTCAGPPAPIVKGSAVVMVMGKPAARILDNTGHGGMILGPGALTVLIGDGPGAGGPGAAIDAAITAAFEAGLMVQQLVEPALDAAIAMAQSEADKIVKLVETFEDDPVAGVKMAAANVKKNVEKMADAVGLGEPLRQAEASSAAQNIAKIADLALTDPQAAAQLYVDTVTGNMEKMADKAGVGDEFRDGKQAIIDNRDGAKERAQKAADQLAKDAHDVAEKMKEDPVEGAKLWRDIAKRNINNNINGAKRAMGMDAPPPSDSPGGGGESGGGGSSEGY